MKKNNLIFLYMVLVISMFVLIQCSGDTAKIRDIYTAEKMFYKAGKLQQNIAINPDIASPEMYAETEQAYRKVIDNFQEKSKTVEEVKGIVQRSWLEIARLQTMQKKNDESVEVYKEIIQKSQDDKELCAVAQFSLARLYEGMQKFDMAIDAYQKVVSDYPPVLSDTLLANVNILQTPIYIARLYRQKQMNDLADKQYSQARDYYEDVTRKWPNSQISMLAQNEIAVSFGDQGDWRRAAGVLEQLILNYKRNQDVFNSMFMLANIYNQQLNQQSKALTMLNQIEREYANDQRLSNVLLAKGSILLAQNSYHQARNEFKKILDEHSNNKDACIQAQMAVAKSYEMANDWKKALNEYQWVVENYPKSRQALDIPFYIGEYYLRNNERNLANSAFESAIKEYEGAIVKYPNTILAAMAYDYMARCHMRLENWHNATDALSQLLEMKPPVQTQISTKLMLASIYQDKIKNEQQAIDLYADILKNYPKLPIADKIEEQKQKLERQLVDYRNNNKPPTASNIRNAKFTSESTVEVNWDVTFADDFSSYKLYRSTSPNVDTNSEEVAQIFNPNQTSYNDLQADETNTYYYRLYVCDKGGLTAASNTMSAKYAGQKFTANVTLEGSPISSSTALLRWNKIDGKDFDSYKIYRSRNSGVNIQDELVKSVFDVSQTTFEDQGLSENNTYYYKVFAYNSKGAKSGSNEISVRTEKNAPPRSVAVKRPTLVDKSTVKISWDPSVEKDFAMYRIYRSEQSPVSTAGTPVWMSSNKHIDSYKDSQVRTGKKYYYKVVVFDEGGLSAESAEVSVDTGVLGAN